MLFMLLLQHLLLKCCLVPAEATAVAVDALHAVVASSVAEVLPPVPAESAVFVVLEIGNLGGLGFGSLEF